MAGQRRNPAGRFAAVLLCMALAVARAQSPGGLAGKLTDLYSKPLAGVTLVARNQTTGTELRTTTERNGSYRFAALPAGEYTLEASSATQGTGQLTHIVITAGYLSRLQSAMRLTPSQPALAALPASPPVPASRAALPLPSKTLPVEPNSLTVRLPALDATAEAPKLAALPLAARPAPPSLVHRPEPEAPQLDAALRLPEPLAMAVPAQRFSNARKPATTPPSLRVQLADHAETANLPLPAQEFPAAVEATTEEPHLPSSWQTPAEPAVQLAKLGAAPALTPATQLLNQLWGGGMAFAAGVAAVSALRPSLAALAFEPPEVNKEEPTQALLSSTLEAQQLENLPSTGRRWQELVAQNAPATELVNVEGEEQTRGHQPPAVTSIDGVSMQSAFAASDAQEESTVNEAAVSTVQVEERGTVNTAMGSGAAVETRSGSEQLHGQLFLFSRQRILAAQNPLSYWVRESEKATSSTVARFTAEPHTPPDLELVWGFGLGGRIRSKKLFWFGALSQNLRDFPVMASPRHPELYFAQPANDQLQVLSARLGVGSTNPLAAGVAQYSKVLENMAGLMGQVPRSSQTWGGFLRLDWLAGERNRLTAEISSDLRHSPGGGWGRLGSPYGTNSFGESRIGSQWLLVRWQSWLTPNLMAISHASVGRTLRTIQPGQSSAYESQLIASAWGRLPQIVTDARSSFTIGNPASFGPGSNPDERRLQWGEGIEWVHRKVLVKAGLQLNHNQDWQGFLHNQTGSYHYANLLNFASDALSYQLYGVAGQLDPYNQHNCDQTGRVWRDANNQLRGLGYLPCYSYYTQTMGPTNWWLNTNDWTSYAQVQVQPLHTLALSAGLRWQRELMPPPIARLSNPALPLTASIPSPGNEWAPRFGLSWGSREDPWPILRLGYGMYFGRTQNATLMTALTHTGSSEGNLDFFLRPTDNLTTGGAPPFPYVLTGQPTKMVKPGAVEFGQGFRNGQVHQALLGLEEKLPGRFRLTASAMLSLSRRLPVTLDTNYDATANPGAITYEVVDPAGLGPIKKPTITVPFYASWPSATGTRGRADTNYQQIIQVQSRANSTYEAAGVRLERTSTHGPALHLRYIYAHAMDWNPNESTRVTGTDVLDPANFALEYGASDLDIRHSLAGTLAWQPRWHLERPLNLILNGWRLSSSGQFHSGRPYTMRTSSALVRQFVTGSSKPAVALAPGMNGSGGDNRVYGVGRNTYRYPATWKVDLRLARHFDLGKARQLELLAESFNLFNHRNVTRIETIGYWIESGATAGSLPRLNFMNGTTTGSTAFGQPLEINSSSPFRERQVQFGLRMHF